MAGGDDTPRSTGGSRGGGDNDNAGHSPAQTPVAAQVASEGAGGRAGPAPSPRSLRKKAGGDNTPRTEGATGRMANEAMTERDPPDRPQAPNAGGRRGEDGTAQRTEGGDDTLRRESAAGRMADKAMTKKAPPKRPRALNASGQEGGGKGEVAPPPSGARPRRAARERGGAPDRTGEGTPHEGGHRNRKGAPSMRTARLGPKGG